ncbi:MAG: hypothetical protein IIC13_07150, partial [SAR324 cluster bacterium]|nr:hypothetical protein [SAR324 cluster bacterium]
FSTAKTVTDLSGRGVGLDVVKTALEKLGGKMHLTTKTGVGTMFEFHFPIFPNNAASQKLTLPRLFRVN